MTYLASAYLLFVLHLLHCFCFESLILFLLLFLLFLLDPPPPSLSQSTPDLLLPLSPTSRMKREAR
jgi:hypothetical protein